MPLKRAIIDSLGKEPTDSQLRAIDKLTVFLSVSSIDTIFLLKGYAGTGKTSLLAALVSTLEKWQTKCVLLAPTGRAAKVLALQAGKPAFTVHKKIYRRKAVKEGSGMFVLDRNLHKRTIFIVDEASMIANESAEQAGFGSGRLLNDLLEYVYSEPSCKLILSGDTAQLPPVGLPNSPALDAELIENLGFKILHTELTDVVRQDFESGILFNATELRNALPEYIAEMGFPQLFTKQFADIQRLTGSEIIETISNSYDKQGVEDTLIVCRSNKQANRYNEGIRRTVLYRDEQISAGDFVMVVKNNYFWTKDYEEIDFIANGDIAEITKIGKYKELYGFNFAEVRLRFADYNNLEIDAKVILNTLTSEAASLSYDDNKRFYESVAEDYSDILNKRTLYEKIKENPFFNALQIKFAYSVTCHKAQGGQWRNVFVDQGFIKDDAINKDFLRWLYTAITRATEKLYLVNFKDEFFEEDSLLN